MSDLDLTAPGLDLLAQLDRLQQRRNDVKARIQALKVEEKQLTADMQAIRAEIASRRCAGEMDTPAPVRSANPGLDLLQQRIARLEERLQRLEGGGEKAVGW